MLRSLFSPRQTRKKIFVPSSSVAEGAERYAMVQSIVNWLNVARDQGCYIADEIAEEAPQLYNADYYYAQVCNGGHAQFRHNSRMDPMTLIHAQNGLLAAGLTELHSCISALVEFPEMEKQVLEELDTKFFACYKNYHAKMNDWFRPKVKVIPDAKYEKHLQNFLKHDVVRGQRFRDLSIFDLQGKIQNGMLAGFSHMARGLGYNFLEIRPGSIKVICGEQFIVWRIAVSDGVKNLLLYGMEIGGRYLLVPEVPNGPIETDEALILLVKSGCQLMVEDVKAQCAYATDKRLGIKTALLLENVPDFDLKEVTALNYFFENPHAEHGDAVLVNSRNRVGGLCVIFGEARALVIDVGKDKVVAKVKQRTLAKAVREFDSRHRVH